jgi:hypothetical protein
MEPVFALKSRLSLDQLMRDYSHLRIAWALVYEKAMV